jgi:8-oxo-dGTP pyrophosphatase MutT (NUDIX family)
MEPADAAAEDVARLERLRTSLRCSSPQILPAVRRAAVACLLRRMPDGSLDCLFITRAAHPGDPWSGDVAWPGGRLEKGETELQAAVRETAEEIGIDLRSDAWKLLGPLPDRPAVRTTGLPKLVVRAFVFMHEHNPSAPLPAFTPAPHEVDAVWWVPLRTLTDCPCPLPFFDVPVARLQTRLPMLRSPRVRAVASAVGLDTALFPYVTLPAPDRGLGSEGPFRLWGVTLGLSALLVEAADGDAARLRVPPWRLRSGGWDACIDVLALFSPQQWERA